MNYFSFFTEKCLWFPSFFVDVDQCMKKYVQVMTKFPKLI